MQAIIVTLILMTLSWQSYSTEGLVCYVYLPTTDRPRAVQDGLSGAYPNVSFVVFGRFQEFRQRVSHENPDAILTLPLISQEVEGYQTVLQGYAQGQSSQALKLLTVGEQTQIAEEMVVGVVDLLGRRAMQEHTAKMLNLKSVRVRTVTKLEDLLTLLQFQDVDAILVQSSTVPFFINRSRLDLHAHALNQSRLGLPSIAIRVSGSGTGKRVKEAFVPLSSEIQALLGVESWQEP